MLTRRDLLAGCMILALGLAAFPGHAASTQEEARQLIESLADKAIAALTVKEVPREERVKRFRVLLHEHFAVKTIGRWVMGRYWRKATNGERTEFLKLFENLLVSVYVDRFANYAGVTLMITKTVTKGDADIIVYSKILRPDGSPLVRVDWRVRKRKGEHKVIDVMVEGVSLGQTQRSEVASVIRKNGGKIQSLLDEMRKKFSNGDA
ncbi:MAG: ABC transporter substrate-binding protein [Alphaproteobacteria bacterium]|nr:ABC transporter substrate-binding protein [Alphaproteobacteria bacterium]